MKHELCGILNINNNNTSTNKIGVKIFVFAKPQYVRVHNCTYSKLVNIFQFFLRHNFGLLLVA